MISTPTILTLLRLALLLPMAILFYVSSTWAVSMLFILYVLSAASDALDGYIARKYDQITPFGTFLDPLSDKIFVSTIMILLIATGRVGILGVLFIMIIIAREFVVSGLREYLGGKNITLPVTKQAKWKTAAQMGALGLLILAPLHPVYQILGLTLLCAATVLTVITGVSYMRTALPHLT